MKEISHPLQWAVDGPPIGIWLTTAGTFDVVSQTQFVFHADGTGNMAAGNAFGFSSPRRFEWVHSSAGELNFFVLDPDISAADNAKEKADEINWDTLAYTTDTIATDMGNIAVLRDINPSFPDCFPIAFWYSHHPIRLISRNTGA